METCANSIANVKPLPNTVWRQIYSQSDELDEIGGEELKAAQSQGEPE